MTRPRKSGDIPPSPSSSLVATCLKDIVAIGVEIVGCRLSDKPGVGVSTPELVLSFIPLPRYSSVEKDRLSVATS